MTSFKGENSVWVDEYITTISEHCLKPAASSKFLQERFLLDNIF